MGFNCCNRLFMVAGVALYLSASLIGFRPLKSVLNKIRQRKDEG